MHAIPILAELNAGEFVGLVICGLIALAMVIQLLTAMDPAAKEALSRSDHLSADPLAPTTYHVWIQNAVCGPYTPAELRTLRQQGQIHSNTLMQVVGSGDWLPLTVFEDVLRAPQRTIQASKVVAEETTQKTGQFDLTKAGVILLSIAVLLALFLGLGLVELLLLSAGIILLVVGLTRK